VLAAKKNYIWKIQSRTSDEEPPENLSGGKNLTVLRLAPSDIPDSEMVLEVLEVGLPEISAGVP